MSFAKKLKRLLGLACRGEIALLLLLLLALSLLGGMVAAQEPVARLYVFYAEECTHCRAILDEFLPSLKREYGDQLQIRLFEISIPRNYEVMLKLEERYQVAEPGIPEIFVGDEALVGEEEIRASLPGLIERYLAQGGCDFPSEDIPVPPPTPIEGSSGEGRDPSSPKPAIYLAYFYQAGCQECDRVAYELEYLKSRYPELVIRAFDIFENAALAEALAERYHIPPEKRLVAPVIFVGQDHLLGKEINNANLEALLAKYPQGTQPLWEGIKEEEAKRGVIERFQSLGPLTVLAAGLVDGVNPCAFAAIVFFISYLAIAGRRGREILFVGAAFTVAVFLAYLLVGLGVLTFLQSLRAITALSRLVYQATAVLCLILAALSLYDYYKVRRGKPTEMILKLPNSLQKRVHKTIRERRNMRGYVLAAFVTGFVISLKELPCSGQVYLPTIIFVSRAPELRMRAILYLVLYNLMFVIPLIILFLLAFYGVTSRRLAAFAEKRTGVVKLLMAGVFVLLAVWLLAALP